MYLMMPRFVEFWCIGWECSGLGLVHVKAQKCDGHARVRHSPPFRPFGPKKEATKSPPSQPCCVLFVKQLESRKLVSGVLTWGKYLAVPLSMGVMTYGLPRISAPDSYRSLSRIFASILGTARVSVQRLRISHAWAPWPLLRGLFNWPAGCRVNVAATISPFFAHLIIRQGNKTKANALHF